jgi:opacity protein-like surface antigen
MEDLMSVQKWVVGLVLAGALMATDASAQDKAVGFKVRGGTFSAITDLNDDGTANFKDRGYNVGAGISFDFTKHFAVRADIDLARNELEVDGAETGQDLSRLFYDASLQFQYPIKNFTPYLFVGAGATRLHPVGTEDQDETRFAGTGGLGVSYTVPGTQLALGIEGKSWLYKLPESDEEGLKRLQYEASWNAMISYRIPLGAQVVRASR